MYGSSKNILKELDPIHHQSLRIALGAFRTFSTPSLHAEEEEPLLDYRRLKLSINYFLKIKSLPENPCCGPITNSPPSELFENSKTDPPFGTCILPHIFEVDIDDSQYKAHLPPWEQNNIMFDTSLSCFKKDHTSETVFWNEYRQLPERYNSYFEAYTDGSKCCTFKIFKSCTNIHL